MAKSDKPKRLSSPYWVLFVLTVVYVINLVDRSIVYILQEEIKAEFALSDRQMALLGGTAFGLFYAVMGIPIARLAERHSRRVIVAVAVGTWSLLTAVCGIAQSFGHLLLARVGVAVGEAGGTPPSHSIISDYFPRERRATALAIYTLAVPIGLLLGSVVGAMIAARVGWRWTFISLGVPGILAALLVLTVREPPRGNSDPVLPVPGEDPPQLREVLRQAVRNRAFLHVLAGSSLSAFAAYGVTTFTAAFFLRRFSLDLGTVGLVFGLIYGVAAGVGTIAGGAGVDRLARKWPRAYGWLPAICLGLAGPGFMLGFAQDNWITSAVLLLVPGLLATMHYGATFAVVQNSFAPRMRATATAITFLSHSIIGMSLGPLLTGSLSDVFAARAFGGDYAIACSAPGAASAACSEASAAGLQLALVVTPIFFLWAAAHYWRASRQMSSQIVEAT